MRARPEQRHLVLVEAVRPENWRTGQLKSRNAMLLVFLAFPCVVYQGFSWCLAGFVPKLVPIFRKPSQSVAWFCAWSWEGPIKRIRSHINFFTEIGEQVSENCGVWSPFVLNLLHWTRPLRWKKRRMAVKTYIGFPRP